MLSDLLYQKDKLVSMIDRHRSNIASLKYDRKNKQTKKEITRLKSELNVFEINLQHLDDEIFKTKQGIDYGTGTILST